MIIQDPDGRLYDIPLHTVPQEMLLLHWLGRCIRAGWRWSASRLATVRRDVELYPMATLKFMP